MDIVTKEKRSWMMSRIRGRNTKPEMIVRSLAHQMGFRFRLHQKDLPGKPDLVFKQLNKIIFVHGCFWHHHGRCKIAHIPSTNKKFWREKFEKNKLRDKKNKKSLKKLGWEILTIWECETYKPEKVLRKLQIFL